MATSIKKTVIVGPSWVGDMVMAGALVKRLAARPSPPEIHMVAPPWALPLVERMPHVAKGHALDVPHGGVRLGARWTLGRTLARERFDEAIILPRSIKSALVPFFAGIPLRRGLIGEWRYGLITDIVKLKAKEGRTIDEFVALAGEGLEGLRAAEAPSLVSNPDSGRAAAARHGVRLDAPLVVFCPGAEYGPAKRWPPQHFAALAQSLLAAGARIAILGSGKDTPFAGEIAAGGGVHDLTGKTTLVEAIDLIALSAAVVTNDSGLMHVAAALERPTIALFGSSSPKRTPPLSDTARVLSIDLDCRPCFQRVCPFGHTNCLVQLPVAMVAEAVMPLLKAAAHPQPNA